VRDGWDVLFMDRFKGGGVMWCGAVKGKGGEQTGCGMLSVCGEWIWLGKGRNE